MKLIQKICKLKLLKESWRAVNSGKSEDVRLHSHGIDEENLWEFSQNSKRNLKNIAEELRKGTYQLNSLFGFKEKKKNGNFRLVTAPTVRDRVVQTAILMTIQDFFPKIRNGSSFCLPKSKNHPKVSFIDAFQRIKNLSQQGYIFIFESDIESFFDKIGKISLLTKVQSKLPDNSINDLLEKIVFFEVGNIDEFRHLQMQKRIKLPTKSQGLSQGSPLSPLFANIYLENFDDGLIQIFGQRYIRYVDDFVILCSTKKETRTAYKIAKALLKPELLKLPPEKKSGPSKTKTQIDLSDNGKFTFLGIEVSNNHMKPNISISEIVDYLNRRVFSLKKMRLRLRNEGTHVEIQKKIQIIMQKKLNSKFGVYGYFHTQEELEKVNQIISIKNKQNGFTLKFIHPNKKDMPIIQQRSWQNLFSKKS